MDEKKTQSARSVTQKKEVGHGMRFRRFNRTTEVFNQLITDYRPIEVHAKFMSDTQK